MKPSSITKPKIHSRDKAHLRLFVGLGHPAAGWLATVTALIAESLRHLGNLVTILFGFQFCLILVEL